MGRAAPRCYILRADADARKWYLGAAREGMTGSVTEPAHDDGEEEGAGWVAVDAAVTAADAMLAERRKRFGGGPC